MLDMQGGYLMFKSVRESPPGAQLAPNIINHAGLRTERKPMQEIRPLAEAAEAKGAVRFAGKTEPHHRAVSGVPPESKERKSHCDVCAAFAIAFKNWRLKNNLQLKQIAADLGVSVPTVCTWETGKRFPTGRHFEMLIDYTGLPPCRLFCVMSDKCVPAECLLELARQQP